MEFSAGLNAAGDGVEVEVQLAPGVLAAVDVLADVLGDDILLIQSPGCDQPLQVPLPVAVDPDTGRVRFKRATGKLIFTAAARAKVPGSPATNASSLAALRHPESSSNKMESISSSSHAELLPGAAPCTELARVEEPGAWKSPGTSSVVGTAALEPEEPTAAVVGVEVADTAVMPARASSEVPAPPPPPLPTTTTRSGSEGADSPAAVPGSCSGSAAEMGLTEGPAEDQCPLPDEGEATASGKTSLAVVHQQDSTPAADAAAAAVTPIVDGDGDDCNDLKLYHQFYCDSPSVMLPPCTALAATVMAPPPSPPTGCSQVGVKPAPAQEPVCSRSDDGGVVNAARVAAAFEPTGGTSSRDAGFSFTAPDLPSPSPLPAGLPPRAPPIDCRYLAVANGLRVSAHSYTALLADAIGVRRRGSAAAERRKADKVNEILQKVADTLDAYGYAVLDNYITDAAIKGSRAELRVMEPHYSPGMIWVGKEAETGAQISVSAVRGDVVLWLDDQALNATAFVKDGVRRQCSFLQLQQMLADVDELVFEGLRPRLSYLAGLHRRSDAMMAVYPGKGARFAKHVDNTTMDGRRLTVLTYLNPDWQEKQGGALRLFPIREGAAPVVDVLPVAGRVALFLSAEVAHEVMPAYAPRHAVTLWYFDAGEHAAALTAAKVEHEAMMTS
ncbi:hypothetical protein Vretimale_8065 [Volvox reticuliferus]|uniref:Fe2OG dioxygenase domain-containing protein n=1 Tax=Volvox reticuliferus TaxID=1737510 RepID=A0A8J4LNF7_9CHLO|nr:hypothetical protein Vretimale_8065 [Volvox reticuliferus]